MFPSSDIILMLQLKFLCKALIDKRVLGTVVKHTAHIGVIISHFDELDGKNSFTNIDTIDTDSIAFDSVDNIVASFSFIPILSLFTIISTTTNVNVEGGSTRAAVVFLTITLVPEMSSCQTVSADVIIRTEAKQEPLVC